MPSPTEITVSQLAKLIGIPNSPLLIDVRPDDARARDPHLIPGSILRPEANPEDLLSAFGKRPAIVICENGGAQSQGIAAWLRHSGVAAETLEGGFAAWQKAGQPLLTTKHLPPRDAQGHTVWVTRARPKVDRIACPWLIRRFVDPEAVFLFVAPSEVLDTAKRFSATPFDIPDVFWSHRGERCSFDTMLEEFGLAIPALDRIAVVVRGAAPPQNVTFAEALSTFARIGVLSFGCPTAQIALMHKSSSRKEMARRAALAQCLEFRRPDLTEITPHASTAKHHGQKLTRKFESN